MGTIKTAISLDEALFERVESLAVELKIPRSRVFVLAVEEYIRRREYQKLQEAINEAYSEGPDEQEMAVRRAMRRIHREQAQGQW